MSGPTNPSLLQINTRVWLHELAIALGRPATLDDVPDETLDRIANRGFDWVWLLGVWQTGPAGLAIARNDAALRREYAELLADFTEADVAGSPFAVQAYSVHAHFGGDAALARFRRRLAERGPRLMLDLVPNHTAPDHDWVWGRPEFYVAGSESDIEREPRNYTRVDTRLGPRVLAHGRDPYFSGWSDTLQLNYRASALRRAMIHELLKIADRCDGVRCDMAMLLLPDVIARTWGERSLPADGTPPVDESFWPEAIGQVRERHPEFFFIAEVYWNLEWTLQQQGFDAAYDKRLYDRLQGGDAPAVRGHLGADLAFQRKLVRFLENHDEPRAAAAFSPEIHPAAAVATLLSPGVRLFHEGQFEGRRRRVAVQLGRRPVEPVNGELAAFYERLLALLRLPVVRDGQWRLLECRPAWEHNPTARQFLAYIWHGDAAPMILVAINYGPHQGQCCVGLPSLTLAGGAWRLRDLLGAAEYVRDGDDLAARGLYLDMPAWGFHVFEVTPAS